MSKQILIPTKTRSEMLRTLKVGRNTLRRALMFEVNSEKAKLLREAALERGGLVYSDDVAELSETDVKTTFSARQMSQIFFGKIHVVVDFKTGEVAIQGADNPGDIVRLERVGVPDYYRIIRAIQRAWLQYDEQKQRYGKR